MPRHTPMDSDEPSIDTKLADTEASEAILRPEVIKRPINLRSAPLMRWLLVAASLGVLFFI